MRPLSLQAVLDVGVDPVKIFGIYKFKRDFYRTLAKLKLDENFSNFCF